MAEKKGTKKPTKAEGGKKPKAEGAKKPAAATKPKEKKEPAKEPKPATKPAAKKTAPAKDEKTVTKKAPAKKAEKPAAKPEAKKEEPEEDVTIVEEGEETPRPEHKARAKPELDDKTRELLTKRRSEDARRPAFRRQQWYYYRRLERTGWRRPRGQDSAQRRRFGYRPSVVKVGFRGPKAVRGLHPSGFEEVRVETVGDLESIDPKKQAARVSGRLGRRKLKEIYDAADGKKIRILNRRSV